LYFLEGENFKIFDLFLKSIDILLFGVKSTDQSEERFIFLVAIHLVYLFSYIRGLLALIVGFILEQVDETSAIFILLIPIFSLLIHIKSPKFNRTIVTLNPLIWITVVIIKTIEIKFLLIILGLSFTFGSLSHILLLKYNVRTENQEIMDYKSTSAQITIVIFLLDQSIRGLNYGQEPLYFSQPFAFISSFLFALFSFLFYLSNKDLLEFKHQLDDNQNSQLSPSIDRYGKQFPIISIMVSLFLLIYIYLFGIGNSGLLSLTLNVTPNIATITILLIFILISFFFFLINRFSSHISIDRSKKSIGRSILIILCFLFIFSINYYLWYDYL